MTDKTLNEGKWLSKIKDLITPKPIPTYTVELSCYPPFKAEPVVWKISDVYSLDDEKIKWAYESLRRQYPKSPIRMSSPLGNKTFYENSTSEYQLKVYDKESSRVDTFSAGTLPQAMSMCEELWNANPDSYKNIEVIHNNNVVTSYNGLEEGFTMNLNAAQQQPQSVENPEEQNEDLAKYDAYDSEFDAMKNELGTRGKAAVDAGLKAYDKQTERDKRDTELELEREKETKRKSYTDNGGQSFASKLLNNNVTKNLAAAGLTGLTGGAVAPMFAKGITDHGIDMINNYNKETQRIDKAEKDFDQRAEKNKKSDKAEDERIKNRKDFEKKLTDKYSSSVGYRRQDDIEKQAKARAIQAAATKAAKDAYAKKAKASSTSKAQEFNQKAREAMRRAASRKKGESLNEAELEHSWVNQRKDIANIDEFIELAKNGIHPVLADARRPKWHNVFAEKQSDKYVEVENQPLEIMVVLDGVEEIKHPKTGEPVKVAVIKEKIPTGINQESGSVTYKDGERHRITFNQFRKLINDPVNAEILQKFEKANPDDPSLFVDLYTQAKSNMDEMYPNWEKSYWDEYDLKNYTENERADIYLYWKDNLKDTAYQDGHELTADEVKREFALPKLQKRLKQLGSLTGRLDQNAIDNLLKQLPENKADELLDNVSKLLEDSYDLNLGDIEKKVGEFMSTTPALLACENVINKLTGGTLQKLENSIPSDKKDEYEDEKTSLLNKYIKKVNLHGVIRAITDPSIMNHKDEIIKEVENLRKKYNVSKWGMDVNQVKQSVNTELSQVKSNDTKSVYPLPGNQEEIENIKRKLDALKTNKYHLKSEISKIENEFMQGLISKEDVFDKIKELSNSKDDSWENVINSSFSNNKNDADNGIGILDRIDRSLKAHKDVDTKGIRISSKYRKLLDNMLDQLKAEYPEGNEEELGDVIKSWYNDILKPELSKETSVNKKLQNYIVGD